MSVVCGTKLKVAVNSPDIIKQIYSKVDGVDVLYSPTEKELSHVVERFHPTMVWFKVTQRKLLEPQLDAIKSLITRGYDNIGLMISTIHHADDLEEIKKILQEKKLGRMDFGVLINTSASALVLNELADKGVKFVFIDADKLTKQILASDDVSLKEFHPAVLKMIDKIIKDSKSKKIVTSIHGEACSNIDTVKNLIGAGINSISVEPKHVELMRHLIARCEKHKFISLFREGKAIRESINKNLS